MWEGRFFVKFLWDRSHGDDHHHLGSRYFKGKHRKRVGPPASTVPRPLDLNTDTPPPPETGPLGPCGRRARRHQTAPRVTGHRRAAPSLSVGCTPLPGPQNLTIHAPDPSPAGPSKEQARSRPHGRSPQGHSSGIPRRSPKLGGGEGRGEAGSPTSPLIGGWRGVGRGDASSPRSSEVGGRDGGGAGRRRHSGRGRGLVGGAAGRREAVPRRGRDWARGTEPALLQLRG